MEQCENAASLLASVREQEMQFERLTRALEEERRSVGPSGTLPRPLPTLQVTPSQPITQQQGSRIITLQYLTHATSLCTNVS